jgi:hypothetical protein
VSDFSASVSATRFTFGVKKDRRRFIKKTLAFIMFLSAAKPVFVPKISRFTFSTTLQFPTFTFLPTA